MLLQKAYVTTTQDVLFPASLLDKLEEQGFGVTRENLAVTMGGILRSWRASMSVIRDNGLIEEFDDGI
jgi:hypothetical protein